MAEYDNTNTFTLFLNDKGDNPKRPDRSGNLNVGGVEYRMSGWIRQSAKGEFLSGTVQLKESTKSEENNEDVPF